MLLRNSLVALARLLDFFTRIHYAQQDSTPHKQQLSFPIKQPTLAKLWLEKLSQKKCPIKTPTPFGNLNNIHKNNTKRKKIQIYLKKLSNISRES